MTNLQHVELGVLGPLQVRQGGIPVMIPGAKPRAILTMLGLHSGSVVPADVLLDLLWGDRPPRTAAKALQTHISALRRALGEGFVLTDGTGWTLAGATIDAAQYKSAARLGRDAGGDVGQAAARFEEALTLWRGIPELPDSRRGSSEKTRWIEGHAALVEDRADALLATGRAAEIVGDLEAAVAEAPLRERRWGQLMLALYRAGRQGEALGAYQRARTLLTEELGVDPGPELRRLEAAVVAQDASLDIHVSQSLSSVMRAVTFLLTDIEGSTAAWEHDADAMAVALARHDELVEQVVTSRGGRLIKTRGEGDATFSVFERPSAAAAAAIELQDVIKHEPWELRDPVCIRIALHTGEVEFRDGDYFGRAVNRAARLRSIAAGGQILCSGATAELVIDTLADDVVLTDLGMRQLRNLPRPEHVFELRMGTAVLDVAPTDEVPLERPEIPAVLAGTGPFVGRGPELELLASVWQEATAGSVRTVLIAGEPGVGKTRLAGEWSRHAYEQQAVVLYGRCDEDLGAPYQPFAEALRLLVPCLGAARLRGLRGVEVLLPLVPALADVVPDLAAPTRADPDTERYALFDAVVAVLEIASASAPLVLVLDDLHWAAKPTLLLLRHILRFGDHARIQIVGTYRSTDLDRSHPLAATLADLHRDGTANRLQLGGLDDADVTAYVTEAGYDDDLARALVAVTGGNPFFLIEALRHVDESGGAWDQSTLPQGVREAVSRRLSRLSTEANKALAAAAVVGSRFALDLVEEVVGDDLIDAFDEAAKAGIVIEEAGGRYRFNHALVRQSLLAELASVRRMRLHQRIAVTLERVPGADDQLIAELAYHYFECAWAGNASKALQYCRLAADKAMAHLAYEGAAELYGQALHALEEIDDQLPDRDDQVAELLIVRCEALLAGGDVASAVDAVAQLRSAADDSVRFSAWATCFDGQLRMQIHPEHLAESAAALSGAAASLAELGDAAGEAKAHTVRAGCLARLGRIADCEAALDDALTTARRTRDNRWVNAVLANAPLAALWGPNPVPRAGGRCLDVVRLLRITTDSPAVEATSTRCQALLEAFRGRTAAARRMIDAARRTVIDLGLRHALLEVEQFAGFVELVADDPAAAEVHLRKAYNGFRRMRLDTDTAETAAVLGRACLLLDQDAEADELCTESEHLAGNALKASIAWRTLRALLLSRNGVHDEALRAAKEAVALAERTDALVDHADACSTLASVLTAAGDIAGARVAGVRAAELYERKGAVALADRARESLGQTTVAVAAKPPQELSSSTLDNSCVRAATGLDTTAADKAWSAYRALYSGDLVVESRRKTVGINLPVDEWPRLATALVKSGVEHRHVPVAIRGEHLALFAITLTGQDQSAGAPTDEILGVYSSDATGRINRAMWFDTEDHDAAFTELDARYLAGEAAPYARTWSAFTGAVAETNLHEVPIVTQDWVSVDHRRGRSIAAADAVAYLRESVDRNAGRLRIENVHRLTDSGTVATYVGYGTSADGFEAEWRGVYLLRFEGEKIRHVELFDEEGLEAALSAFDRFHASVQALANAAGTVVERYVALFEARDWAAISMLLADNICNDDRRRVANSGIRHGRAAELASVQALAEGGFVYLTSHVVATRGDRLLLTHMSGRNQRFEELINDVLCVFEIDSDEKICALIIFDHGDFGSAVAELDARYMAGEAAAYADTWSVIAKAYATLSQHGIPQTTTDFVDVDHRGETAFGFRELIDYFRAGQDQDDEFTTYVEAVHRLDHGGAVIGYAARETSTEGFDAEWRGTALFVVEGCAFSRCEVFDEADVAAAVAGLQMLQRPTTSLENAACRVFDRLWSLFAARDWDGLAEAIGEHHCGIDRRRVVNAGSQLGRDAAIRDMHVSADVGFQISMVGVKAIRGDRLAIALVSACGPNPDSAQDSGLNVIEIDAAGRLSAVVVFDIDDLGAAVAELDARYLAGEAAPYAQTWAAIAEGYAAFNRHELPPTTPDWVNVDHRHAIAFAPGEHLAYMHATWDVVPGVTTHIETVHRLDDLGAVITHMVLGTSPEGFDAEWRELALVTCDGDKVNRIELFEVEDLDAALARFDELQPKTPRLANTTTRVVEQFFAHFAIRDWDAMTELLIPDVISDDRRHVINAGIRRGRDVEMANWHATDELWTNVVNTTALATRGNLLALFRFGFTSRAQQTEPFSAGALAVVEINAHHKIAEIAVFDLDDLDGAVAELDRRYAAGDAAEYSVTWSAVTDNYSAVNRGQLTEVDWINIDRRRGTPFSSEEIAAGLTTHIDLTPDLKVRIEAVHRLSDSGTVVTNVSYGTSPEGFSAEWRMIQVFTVENDRVTRCELYDETDLGAALAHFDNQTATG